MSVKVRSSAGRVLLLFFILVLFVAGPVHETAANASGEELQIAPLNPEFVAYMERLQEGKLKTSTSDGYPLGYIPSPLDLSLAWEQPEDEITVLALPGSYDLRETGRVTAVRDQSPYGSCWAFAAFGSLESHLMPQNSYNFSENNLMWQHGFDWGPYHGGNSDMATAYLARWCGPVLEIDDPYFSKVTKGLSPVRHVQAVEYVPQNRNMIKQKVMQGGALFTAMYWHDDPYGWGSGLSFPGAWQSQYYSMANNAYYYSGSAMVNHAVAIVGWDDNYDRNKFTNPPPGDGAWIIRNSWGHYWGEGGYFYLSYYDTYAGSYAVAFHNAEPNTSYDRVYQYDWLGNIAYLGYGSNTAYGANIFRAKADEDLVAVSTYAGVRNLSYEIEIYTGVNQSNPASGNLRLTQGGSFVNAGYYTIALENPVRVKEGQFFSVVVRYIAPGYGTPVPVETVIPGYSSAVKANPQEGFISSDGFTWADLGSLSQPVSLCIKAFTVKEVNPVVQHTVSLNVLPPEGGTAGGDGTYKDGHNVTVTAAPGAGYKFVNWTEGGQIVSSKEEYTFTIEADRDLTANFKMLEYVLTLSSSPEAGGSVNGTGTFNHGEEVTVTATADEGYKFVKWTEDGDMVSKDPLYTFTITGDLHLAANFQERALNLSWSRQDPGILNTLTGIAWNKELYVAVGTGGVVLTSPDGINWKKQENNSSETLSCVVWGENQFVAVGSSGTILTSANGTSWKTRDSGVSQPLHSVAWNGNRFVAVGNQAILKSFDGINWIIITPSPFVEMLRGVAWCNDEFITVGNDHQLLYSHDGATWSGSSVKGISNWLTAAAWGSNTYVAVGGRLKTWPADSNERTLLSSVDGRNWTTQISNEESPLNDVTRGEDLFVAVGGSGAILMSSDGNNWVEAGSVTSSTLHAVTWDGKRFVAVGANGTILTSSLSSASTPPVPNSLQVIIHPEQVLTEGAKWRIKGGPDQDWKQSKDVIENISPGVYDLSFKEIAGWEKPADQSVEIDEGENILELHYHKKCSVTAPSRPTGPSSGEINVTYSFSVEGSSCVAGHEVQYRFDWGDGTYSSWSATSTHSNSWETAGTYEVRAQGRCAFDSDCVSPWSDVSNVDIGLPVDVPAVECAAIYWQNNETGLRYLWFMDGDQIVNMGGIGRFGAAVWNIVGVGDLDGDGKTDVVWHNTETGLLYAWLMDGLETLSFTGLGTEANLVWKAVALGDMNNSGSLDVIWENTENGSLAAWFFDGTEYTGFGSLPGLDPGWTVAGAADINSNGHTDLLLQNIEAGERVVWLMEDLNKNSYLPIGVGPGPQWVISAAGDFNGNGHTDLLWTNTETGLRYVEYMENLERTGGDGIGTVADKAWQVVGLR